MRRLAGRIAGRIEGSALALATAATPLVFAPNAWAAKHGAYSAGGAPLGDVMLATGGATVLTIAMLAIGSAPRGGGIPVLQRAAPGARAPGGPPRRAAP